MIRSREKGLLRKIDTPTHPEIIPAKSDDILDLPATIVLLEKNAPPANDIVSVHTARETVLGPCRIHVITPVSHGLTRLTPEEELT